MLYSIKLYTGIITSMYLALSICVWLISLMQSVNRTQFLDATLLLLLLLLLLFALSPARGAINILPLTSIYGSL